MKFNPLSFLNRAEDYYRFINEYELPSSKMKMYFEVSEQALKAILFYFGIESHSGSHQLQKSARDNQTLLATIWSDLDPLLNDYPKLYKWRNESYTHNDAPPVSYPPILDSDLEMGKRVADGLLIIARRLLT